MEIEPLYRLAVRREMDPPKGFWKINQVLPLDNLLGDGTRKFIGISIQYGLDQSSQCPLIKPFCLGVNWDDPFKVEVIFLNIALNDFYIGMMNLFLKVEIPYFTGENQFPSLFKPFPEIAFVAMKPFQCDHTTSVSHDDLEHSLPLVLVESHSREQNFAKTRLFLAGFQLGNLF